MEPEVDIFLEFSFFSNDPVDIGNLISGSSAFSESSLYIWKFLVHVLLKPYLEDFEHYLASMWSECNCAVVWTFFSIAFLWEWKLTFSSPVVIVESSKFDTLKWIRKKFIHTENLKFHKDSTDNND